MPVTRATTTRASAGERDRFVLVQWKPIPDAVEASGFPRDEWTDYRTVYMSRSPVASDERFVSDQRLASDQWRWECEYLADLDPDLADVPKRFRLIYAGRIHDVMAASVLGRNRAIELVTVATSRIEAAS